MQIPNEAYARQRRNGGGFNNDRAADRGGDLVHDQIQRVIERADGDAAADRFTTRKRDAIGAG